MHTSYVDTRAEGHCVVDRGETVTGIWEQEGQELMFAYIGLQDREYSRKDNEWESTSRGEQSDVLVQIERLLQFDKFEYQGVNGIYTYHFKANIPFLAPGRWKEMIGIMEISKRTYLPVRIWAGLPDSSVSWTIELFDYNKSKEIQPPRVAWHGFIIPDKNKDHGQLIKKRLQAMDIDFRLQKDEEGYRLTVPEYYTLEDIEGYFANHTITGYRVTHDKEQAIMIAYVRNNKNVALYCAETLFTQADIKSIGIKFDPASRPLLYVKLRKKQKFTADLAVAIDGVIQHVATLDSDKKINTLLVHTDMHYFELQTIKASIQYVLPEVEVKTLTGESP
jgi:hypothetical protein